MKIPEKDIRWYVVSTQSGRENRIKDYILSRKTSMDLEENIYRVIVAEIEVDVIDKETGLPSGKKRMKNLYPGYVFVEMLMSDEAWFVVRNTPGVTGFIGSSGKGAKPFPVPDDEIEPILKRLGIISKEMYESYNEGDTVRIITGPLEGTEGTIIEFDKDTGNLVIESLIFGRPQRIETNFADTEKINE